MQVDREAAGLSVACPACGRILTIPLVEADPLPPLPTAELSPDEAADAGRTNETNAAPSGPDPATAKPKQPAIGPMLQALLTPRAIHGMLILGGGLSVLGLVVWLCSLGVFENKIVLAAALGLGTLSILGTGWLVALRSRYRLAGQALTFLACVVVPLNLWFYHSQHLLTLDHGLWVGGVVCCLLYAATVYVLRDPLFMYAIEAGVTLTVVLFLGQLGLATNTSYLCLVLMALGLVSVHAERAFSPNDKVFDRRRFGMPLFWSGHIQTGAALVLLLVVQLADWLLQPAHALLGDPRVDHSLSLISQWSGGLLPQSFLLVSGLWLAGAYVYLYSDLVVRRVGVYTYLAAFSLLMSEVAFVGRNLPSDALIAVLALTALAINLLKTMFGRAGDAVQRTVPRLALALSALPVCMGIVLNFRASSQTLLSQTFAPWLTIHPTTWLFVGAMLIVVISNQVSAFLCRRTDARISAVYYFFSATALIVAAIGSLRLLGWETWMRQAPALMVIPTAYLVAGRLSRGRSPQRALTSIAQVAAVVILFLGFAASPETIDRFIQPMQGNADSLWLGILLAEAAAFYALTAAFHKHSGSAILATAAACGAMWQAMAYWGVPAAAHTMLYAGLGVCFLAVSRILGVRERLADRAIGPKESILSGRGLLLFQSGNAIVFISLLAATMQGVMGLPSLNDGAATGLHVWSLIFTTAAGAAAALLMPTANWRRAYATMSIALGGITLLTLGQLSHLSNWQKLEIFSTVVGTLLIVASYVGRFLETERHRDDRVTFGLWLGSMLATVPLAIAVVYHRSVNGAISLPDEMALVTISVLMLLTGFVWQVKSTTLHGGGGLGLYLVVLIVSLGWQPQLAIGVYLAIGGGLLFASGIALSVYRDKLLAIPAKIANKEGVFRIIGWR
jgi:hypothetical protein